MPNREHKPSGEKLDYDADFFLLRTPLLPIETVLEMSDALSAARDAEGDRAATTERDDREHVVAWLRRMVARPDVREALFLASPSLDEALGAWLNEPTSRRAEGVPERTFLYLMRMATRPTPFGVCSGVSVGRIAHETSLRLEASTQHRRDTRLDVGTVHALAELIASDDEVRDRILLFPNATSYMVGEQLRYAEERSDAAGRAHICLVGAALTPPLRFVLDHAQGRTQPDLAAELASACGISRTNALSYIAVLLQNGVLVTELTPTVTGDEPLEHLRRILSLRAPASAARQRVDALYAAVTALRTSGTSVPSDHYRETLRPLLAFGLDLPSKNALRVDLHKPAAGATLGLEVTEEVKRAVALLDSISPHEEDASLQAFRDAFVARWETAAVPLSLALDEELGIGFGERRATDETPLIDDLTFAVDEARSGAFGKREKWLLLRLSQILEAGQKEWRLSAEDIEALRVAERPPLPDAFFTLITLGGAAEYSHANPKVYFQFAGGPSGVSMMGRFCHGDPALSELVREHLQKEEALAPDAIFAEVVCMLPDGAGNLCLRPTLRANEIPCFGRASVTNDGILPLSDLLVTIRAGRVVLFSQRHGREVIARVTTPVNHDIGHQAIYRFLCSLQCQGVRSRLLWRWGPLAGSSFLPRVTYGSTVFSRASWALSATEVNGLQPSAERFSRMCELRRNRTLPRWVAVKHGDNVMPIDLENPSSVDILVALAKGKSIVVEEYLPVPGDSPASGPEGRFANEIMIPWLRRRPGRERCVAAPAASPNTPRVMPVGSPWLYLKLYTGTVTADTLLCDVIAPLAEQLTRAGAVTSWFFLRYGDPDWHLRVRFRGDPAALCSGLLPALHRRIEPFVRDGRVWKVQLDTYVREVERYGGDEGILLAEDAFRADSDATIELLRGLANDTGDARWQLALRGTHLLLDDFSVALRDRVVVLETACRYFGTRLGADPGVERQIAEKFRKLRGSISALVTQPKAPETPYEHAFARRSGQLRIVAEKLCVLEKAALLNQPVRQIAESLVHMFMNRILSSEANVYEYVLYDFLARIYRSKIAISEAGAPQIANKAPRTEPYIRNCA